MLMAFDAAARFGSFSRAGEHLSLTQGAISRQIKALEHQLDVALFRRAGKTVLLTEAGRAYAREINAALNRIQAASLTIVTSPRGGVLNIAILPTFGTRWLMPRFPPFLEAHPDITVNFTTRLSPFDIRTEGIHAAIHYGLPDWPHSRAIYLMGEQSVPVATQAFLQGHGVRRPGDLARLPRLHLSSRPDAWSSWLDAHGEEPHDAQGLVFEQFSTAAQAAAAGLGVALLPKFLIRKELERGEFVIAFDKPVPTTAAYYLMVPDEYAAYAPAIAFADWLKARAGAAETG